MSVNVIVFGGTSEGRRITRMLADAGVRTRMCVATSYGEELVESGGCLEVAQGRQSAEEMSKMIAESGCRLVIDATHPYAREVTANIRAACKCAGVELLRLTRGKWEMENAVTVNSARQAAKVLDRAVGKALLTVGSKEFADFTRVKDYKSRLFARILPSVEALEKCAAAGIPMSRLICMQGPFTHELNAAMIRQLGVSWLVTKESGREGGLIEKLSAARETGCRVILIRRPLEPDIGMDFDGVAAVLREKFGVKPLEEPRNAELAGDGAQKPFFPLFVNLERKRAVLVGGGDVAYRRAKTLLRFGASVRVIAPRLSPQMEALVREGGAEWLKSEFLPQLLEGADIVISATDKREVNRAVGEAARRMRILASIADRREECGFLFPAIVWAGNIVAGLVSVDNNHREVKRAAQRLRDELGGCRK